MTTKDSPVAALTGQARKIAATLKAAERGQKIDPRFDERFAAARRTKESFRVGIVMDDKIITVEMPWVAIQGMTEVGLATYIVGLMREARDALN